MTKGSENKKRGGKEGGVHEMVVIDSVRFCLCMVCAAFVDGTGEVCQI